MKAMRRGIVLMMAVALVLALSGSALAANLVAGPVPAYLNKDGRVIGAEGETLLGETVDKLVYSTLDALIYQQDDALVADQYSGTLRELGLLSCDALFNPEDGYVYYVRTSEPDTLMRLNLKTLRGIAACQADGPIEHLRRSVNGVLVEADGQEYLYLSAQKRLVEADAALLNQRLIVTEEYEARIDADAILTLAERDSEEVVEISTGVLCAAASDNIVYYLQAWGRNARLMAYTVDTGTTARLYRFDEPMWDQIAVKDGKVYLFSKAGALCTYKLISGEMNEDYWDDGEAVEPLMASDTGVLVLYDVADGQTDPRFVEADAAVKPTPTPKPTPVPTPTPDPYPILSKGARGDAVVRLQEKLRELGYLTGSADGVYGGATYTAVCYLQFDMGLSETGTADAAFQRKIYLGNPPTYSSYVTLSRGDSGVRVRDMQARLRELYYSKDAVDGYYGSATTEAVARFQSQKGYNEKGGTISVSQLRALFKSGAPTCTQYYTLRRGDEAPVVKNLNKRLKKLGYFHGTVGESFNRHTENAVMAFQEMAGLNDTGVADARTQRLIHQKDAPTPTPTPEPTPKPDDEQAVKSTVIKTMRAWMKSNLGGTYDKTDAVIELQSKLAELGYMSYFDINGVYNEKTMDAVSEFQRDAGLSANGNANKQTLKAMFLG